HAWHLFWARLQTLRLVWAGMYLETGAGFALRWVGMGAGFLACLLGSWEGSSETRASLAMIPRSSPILRFGHLWASRPFSWSRSFRVSSVIRHLSSEYTSLTTRTWSFFKAKGSVARPISSRST